GSYYKIATKGSKVRFVDSGRVDQTKSGVSFKSPQSESTAIDLKACRDTLLDGIKLKLYESAEGDTLLIRHYFFKEMPVNSILTYATAKRFTGQKGLFRVELFSRKDSATFISTLRDIERLTPKEVSAFRKLLPNTTL
ncbi:MAG TPA: hypothetical protein VLA58_07195, partial [Chitinophagaceae bacterium]|nr:hypothetical protein [Chitinophagaceae bacterium]